MKLLTVNGERSWLALIISIIISEGVGLLGGLVSMNSMNIYKELVLPDFAPPAWVFGPVWTILYLLMGIAAYRIYMVGKTECKNVVSVLFLYGIQLFFNFLWSYIFFGQQNYGVAFFEILILWFFILWTTIEFFVVDKKAGWLMVPYLLWVTFAAFLNYFIWQFNL